MTFNLQCGKVLLIKLCKRFLISNNFLPRNGKHKLITFSAQDKYSVDNLSKYICYLLIHVISILSH